MPAPREPVRPRTRPTFSIAIAAYQAAATIGEALESAFAQTLPPLDVAVCDDGSTDGLEAVVAPWRDRIVFVRQENRGEAAAKNAAARATSGEFVAFLDADDLYHAERLEALADLAVARPDLDVLTTDADLEVEGEVVGRYYPDIAQAFPVEEQALAIIRSDTAVFGAAGVRREAFESAGALNERLRSGGDWELWMLLALAGSSFGLVDEPLYRYRVHQHGTSADQLRGSREAVKIFERVIAVAQPGSREREALEQGLAHHRRIAELTAAEHALRSKAPDRRRRALAIASAPGYGAATRLKALVAAVLPGPAGRRLKRHEAHAGHSRLRKPMPGR